MAYGQIPNDPAVVKRIEDALMAVEAQADDQKMATFYDITSSEYPEAPDAMLQLILSDKNKYIPYLAAQIKDLFVAGYNKAQEESKH
ncbi:hypothetical protein KBA84_02980 [Patescibacteria group bacterium]|nr:hypothetical protein [Patescibacteria group bacterium]